MKVTRPQCDIIPCISEVARGTGTNVIQLRWRAVSRAKGRHRLRLAHIRAVCPLRFDKFNDAGDPGTGERAGIFHLCRAGIS